MKTRIALRMLLILSVLLMLALPASADVWLPAGLTEIESEAFMNAMWLSGSCRIPDGTRVIGAQAFAGCSGLTSLTLPDSLTRIGSRAFANCTGLSGTIILPEGAEVAADAFENCPNLTVRTAGEETNPAELFRWSVSNKQITITGYIGKKTVTSVSVPAQIDGLPVTTIGSYAFSSARYLTSITLPESITTISTHAFSYCSALTTLHLPSDVDSLGRYAFYYCSNLTGTLHLVDTSVPSNAFTGCKKLTVLIYETNDDGTLTVTGSTGSQPVITVPYSYGGRTITAVGREAFAFLTGLEEINLPSGITSIGQSAFYYCSALKRISIPGSVRSIGANAFYNCTALESLSLSDTGMSIGSMAFYNCGKLRGSVSFLDSSIHSSAFASCPGMDVWCFTSISDATVRLDSCQTSAADVTVPATVQGCTVVAMGAQPFYGSSVRNVTLPATFTAIPDEAFYKCTTLESINIPYGVNTIGDSAFRGCTALQDISIPATVDEIRNQAFYGCSKLGSVTIASGHTNIGPYAFASCSSLSTIHLPAGFRNVGNMSFTNTPWLRNKIADLALTATQGCSSDYDRALALHDWLIESTAYDTTYTYYGAEGVLYHGLGVCNAYTVTYGMLLDAVGIEYRTVTGTATDRNSGATGSHAWTLVKINGAWYHIDTTWDDPIPDGRERHTYFCLTDAQIDDDHTWDRSQYPAATGAAVTTLATADADEDTDAVSGATSLLDVITSATDEDDDDHYYQRNRKNKK